MKGTLGRLVGIFEVSLCYDMLRHAKACLGVERKYGLCSEKKEMSKLSILQNRERKHRTYVYILIVTEVLEDWEDSVNIGEWLSFQSDYTTV